MAFDVAPSAYDRFMGRYAAPLARVFLDFALADRDAAPVTAVLDVGCGPGTLTGPLVERYGERAVAAIDPSAPFVAETRRRFPGSDVRAGHAEGLPWPDASFDLALSQLVVVFMDDPVAGLRSMARVVRPGGTVAACVWDLAPGEGPLALFWTAATTVDPGAANAAARKGSGPGELEELCAAAGLNDVTAGRLTVRVPFDSLDDWWQPLTLGVGPAGDYVARLDEPARARLRAACADLLPPAPFEITASAWAVRARVG